MRLFVRPPSRPSEGARKIARVLGARLLRRNNSRYRYRRGDLIINWGNPCPMDVPTHAFLNPPHTVDAAIDKAATWTILERAGVPTVTWTLDAQEARDWLLAEERVMIRTTLRGTQGRGIRVYSLEGTQYTGSLHDFMADARVGDVYVKVFESVPARVTEYRVAVVDGEAIDTMQKRRRTDHAGLIDPYIRSHDRGWVFCRGGLEVPGIVHNTAAQAVAALGLDFGAVDLGLHRGGGRICVYEINSAPGLEGSSILNYSTALGRRIASGD